MSSTPNHPPTDQPPPLWVQIVVVIMAVALTISLYIVPFIIIIVFRNFVYSGISFGGGVTIATLMWRNIIRWAFPKRKAEIAFELEKNKIKASIKTPKNKP